LLLHLKEKYSDFTDIGVYMLVRKAYTKGKKNKNSEGAKRGDEDIRWR
jgi:hypothetical protein